MQCHEFEDRLNSVLDERASPATDQALVAHARRCRWCAEVLQAQQMLAGGLRPLPVPELSVNFAARVVGQFAAERARPAASRAARWWLAASVVLSSAAAVLLCLSLVWRARRDHGPAVASSDPHATLAPRLPVRGNAGNQGGLAMSQAGWLVEAPRLTDHVRDSIAVLPETLPQSWRQIDQVERMAPGFRPLRISLALLWDTLCRAFPSGPEAAPAQETPSRTGWWLAMGPAVA